MNLSAVKAGSTEAQHPALHANQSHGLKLELEGVFNPVCLGLSHVVTLRLLRHLARGTFFKGKVTHTKYGAFVPTVPTLKPLTKMKDQQQ